MGIPTITNISPTSGPSSGGDLLRILGTGFASAVEVTIGAARAQVLSVREEAGGSVIDARTPPHEPATVGVSVQNLDSGGVPIAGETATLSSAYRYLRPHIVRESDLTRLVRALLRAIKRELLENTAISVSVDYDDTVLDDLNVVAISKLPSVVLSGPRLRENRVYSTNVPHEDLVQGSLGPEIVRRRPPFTADLEFTITCASNRTVELLNLMAAVGTFLNRHRWIEMPRDPEDPAKGTVRWEMDPVGEYRTALDGKDDVRSFTCGLLIRGFDVDEGLPLDIGRPVVEAAVETSPLRVEASDRGVGAVSLVPLDETR